MRGKRKGGGSLIGALVLVLILLHILGPGFWLMLGLGAAAIIAFAVFILKVISGNTQGESGQSARSAGDAARDANHTRSRSGGAQSAYTASRSDAVPAAAAQAARPAPQTPQTPPKPKYPPEVQAVVDEGEKAHAELTRLYAAIPNLSVKRRIQELIDVSDKIIADAVADPSDVPQIKKFLDYYLPTTIKLLNSYERMGAQGIEGTNITKTMNSIEGMLDTAIDAYKKLLDSLFANQAMDIETDIQVMNTLLKREGFAGGSAFQTMGQ